MSSAVPEIVVDGSSFRRVVDALSDRVATSRSDQAYARCPAPEHGGDRHPSLSVTWKDTGGRGGRTMVNCHRGCDYRDVLAAVGLAPADLYDTPPFESKAPAGARWRPRREERPRDQLKPKADKNRRPAEDARAYGWQLDATYTYADASGVRVFDVRRWSDAPVKFTVRSYDRNGVRVVAKRAPAVERRVLLHLPEVLAAKAAGDPVYVCEGEKDAEAVHAAGAVATTNPFGAITADSAGDKWLPQYTEALAGAHVVLVADRDPIDKGVGYAGYRHVLYVAGQLADVAASVRVVEPSGTEPSDAYDHLVTAGRPLAELVPVEVADLRAKVAEADQLSAGAAPAVAAVPAPAAPEPVEEEAAGESATVYDFPTPGRGGAGIGGGGGRGPGGPGGGGDDPERVRVILRDDFRATDRGLYKVKIDGGRELWSELLQARVRLAARVVEDLADGARPQMTHVDLVTSRDGEEHTLEAVDRDAWESCAWVSELPWSSTFNDTKQGHSTLRNAIIATSGDAPRITMYGSLGWQKIGGRWCYVHAGGARDANGVVEGVRVNVPQPLEQYVLPPAPATAEDLRKAVLASTAILDAVPERLAAPLLGACYRACLGYSRATVMPVGGKAGGKTSLLALAVQHYAPSARHDNMPGAGAGEDASTKVGLAELRFRAGDVLLPLDDLAPDRGVERASVRGAQIGRSQYNRTGPVKGTRKGGMAVIHRPRGLVAVSGEEGTTVESAESRFVSLRVTRGDVDVDCAMPLLDMGEEPELRAKVTAAMVEHYAEAMPMTDWLRQTAAELRAQLRDPSAVDPNLDVRHSEGMADMAAGWRAMLDMATDRGALTVEEAAELWARAWEGMAEAKRLTVSGSATRTAADRVRELLTSALVRRDVGLLARKGGLPVAAERYGWEEAPPSGAYGPAYRLAATTVGWTDGAKVWLQPGAVFPALVRQASGEHDPLTYTRTGLGQALADAGVIRTRIRNGVRSTTVNVRLGAESQMLAVWEFDHEWLFPTDDEEPDPPVVPPAPAPALTGPRPARAPAPAEAPEPVTEAAERRQETPEEPSATVPSPATGKPVQSDLEPLVGRGATAGERRRAAKAKYRGVAAVCEPGKVWMARLHDDPESFELPADVSLSALLDGLGGLELGHVDGRGRYFGAPEAWGQAWLMPDLRRALGWPASLGKSPAPARMITEELAAAGWRVLGGLGFWNRLVHDDGPSLVLVVPDWLTAESSLKERTATAHQLATRLARYAETTGITWQWSPASTGAQLALVTRPRLLKRGPQQLPAPAGKSNRERPFEWQRPPTSDEQRMGYVHLYDFNALYLGAAASLPLAWGEYEHVKAPAVDLERPGYWKLPQKAWEHALLPDPFAVWGRGERETMIVTTPTLKLAAKLLEWDVEPIEGWLAVETLAGTYKGRGKQPPTGFPGAKGYGRLLDKWAEELSKARLRLADAAEGSDDKIVRENVKGTYAHGVGRFDFRGWRPGKGERASRHPLWRPDWRHHIIAQGRFVLMHRILEAEKAEGRHPLAIMTDGVVYASDSPDWAEAAPAGFTPGPRVGQVNPPATAPMAAVTDLLRQGDKPTKRSASGRPGLSDVIRKGGVANG